MTSKQKPSTEFSSLPLEKDFLGNLQQLGYHEMTAVQSQSLPPILAVQDVKAQASTGSGKTAAFGIGILQRIDSLVHQTQALVLCPTRELADQVSKEIRRLARPLANTKILSLCGGAAFGPQLASLEHQPHIIVGTPGRLLKHLQKGSVKLKGLKLLVLDEADRMLDMGFQDDIMQIIEAAPGDRQTLLFSATFPSEIEVVSKAIQRSPVDIRIQSLHDNQVIRQIFYEVRKGEKNEALYTLLTHHQPLSCLVFCNRKQQAQVLSDELCQRGFHALALHGDLEQRDREQVLARFSNGSASILVATDVAARGLDIKELHAVINFDLSRDPEVHIHRIGRTGRAGKTGLALSLFLSSEAPTLLAIENYQNTTVNIENAPIINQGDYQPVIPAMTTLCINGGRKNKLRAGDILGALTANQQVTGNQIGKIDIYDNYACVAVDRTVAKESLKILSADKIKGKKFLVRHLTHRPSISG